MALIAYMRNRSIGDNHAGYVEETIDPSASGTIQTYSDILNIAPEMVKDGATFIEWNTARDGSGTSYNGGETVSGTVKAYAIWTAVSEPYIANGDQLLGIADAIRNKTGSSESMTFPDGFVEEIGDIVTLAEGTANANAVAADIRYMKTAYVNGQRIVGTGIMFDEIAKNEVTYPLTIQVTSPVTISKGQTVTLQEIGATTFPSGMFRYVSGANTRPIYNQGSTTVSPSYDRNTFLLTPTITWPSTNTANVSWEVKNKTNSTQTFAKNATTITINVICYYPA